MSIPNLSLRSFLAFSFFLIISMATMAQQKEGRIDFLEVMKFNFDLELPDDMPNAAEILKMLPKSKDNIMQLSFNENLVAFKPLQKEDMEDGVVSAGGGGVQMEFQMIGGGGTEEYYADLKKETYTHKKDIMGRVFLVRDETEKIDWKISGETKKVLNHDCSKATFIRDSSMVTAWFAPGIPVSSGPNGYGQLPGMILELVLDDGNHSFVAQEIEFGSVPNAELKAPKKGKVVNKKEYEKIMEEKMKEMEATMGGRQGAGEHRIMITR